MDYEKQRKFLNNQMLWFSPAAAACVLLLVLVLGSSGSGGERVLAAAIALGLLWAAYYLPNYLGMDADPWRRLRWVARARWVVLLLAGIVALLAGAKLALAGVGVMALLHLGLLKPLLKLERRDLREPLAARLAVLGGVYAVGDGALLWIARNSGVASLLLAELLLCFVFLAAVLARPRSPLHPVVFGTAAAGYGYILIAGAGSASFETMTAAAVFLWTAGTFHLLVRANQQNLANYDDLLENLRAFTKQSREALAGILLESVPRLAENWQRVQPHGQKAVTAWYRENALLYLYANCQHHLLYRHIVYTLGLLRVARGRVLDFGGGNGDFSRALARRGVDVTYLDVPGDAAEYLRWRVKREALLVKLVDDVKALEGPFDVIYCLDVIEHLAELPPVFERFRQLLRPGGWLLATYYNGPTSSAPMHIDPGYDARQYLLTHGFRDIKSSIVGVFSPELMRKNHFMILEREAS
jgi:2-polyprenyl-3-methyl-5-hydroxy-6-metoxy-1,4-benzoquinol methylase